MPTLYEMSVIWLRAAVVLYSAGLLHAILTVLRRRARLFQPALVAFVAGAMLHLVSLVEETFFLGSLPLHDTYETASSCAFLIALVFLFVYWRHRIQSHGVFLFPLVFVLALIGSLGAPAATWSSPKLRDAWLMVHVALVLAGYAALLVMAASSIIYLIQERHLKTKDPGVLTDRLPPLGTLDELITKSMAIAFVLITLAVIAATIWASIESGSRWITEPKILISLVTWTLYLLLTFLRVTVGWRGRKAAYMAILVVGFSTVTWAAHAGLRNLFAP
ncbi:MAG: cytochrome c biogenesis protein CcsA [Bryobacterales bacterium]|nr:cytochrome c biogenesis protein CcsA [Bryobacterales bacterium]